MRTEAQPPIPDSEMPRATAEAPRSLDSATLLGTKGEVEITHRDQIYRLRKTRQGKLILTK